MQVRSIVPAVVAALAVGGYSAYAANSHGSTVRSHAATASVQAQLHSERMSATAGDTITPIGALLPVVRPATVPNTGTQTAAPVQVQVQTAPATSTCETGDHETGDENVQTGTAGESETGDHNNQAAAATENESNDSDEAEAACQPVTAACTAARDALKAFLAADKVEDQAEPKPETDAAKAADQTEDAAEKLSTKTAVQAVIAACGGGQHED